MIRIYCAKADATLLETETLTAGMVNIPDVLFTFSSDWEGLGKTAIVRAGTVIREVVLQNNQITIPSECLAKAGVNLIVGVWGGNFVTELPTVWCACGEIQDSTNPSAASNHEDPTTSEVAQMLGYAERGEAALDSIEYLVDSAEVVKNMIDIIPEHIDDNSEAWAVGTRFGQAVTSEDPTYHNNSKYYSDRASESNSSALSAKDDAIAAKVAAEAAKTEAQTAQATAEAAALLDVPTTVDAWLDENIAQETGYALDSSLSSSSSAAPANLVGAIKSAVVNGGTLVYQNAAIGSTGTINASTTRVLIGWKTYDAMLKISVKAGYVLMIYKYGTYNALEASLSASTADAYMYFHAYKNSQFAFVIRKQNSSSTITIDEAYANVTIEEAQHNIEEFSPGLNKETVELIPNCSFSSLKYTQTSDRATSAPIKIPKSGLRIKPNENKETQINFRVVCVKLTDSGIVACTDDADLTAESGTTYSTNEPVYIPYIENAYIVINSGSFSSTPSNLVDAIHVYTGEATTGGKLLGMHPVSVVLDNGVPKIEFAKLDTIRNASNYYGGFLWLKYAKKITVNPKYSIVANIYELNSDGTTTRKASYFTNEYSTAGNGHISGVQVIDLTQYKFNGYVQFAIQGSVQYRARGAASNSYKLLVSMGVMNCYVDVYDSVRVEYNKFFEPTLEPGLPPRLYDNINKFMGYTFPLRKPLTYVHEWEKGSEGHYCPSLENATPALYTGSFDANAVFLSVTGKSYYTGMQNINSRCYQFARDDNSYGRIGYGLTCTDFVAVLLGLKENYPSAAMALADPLRFEDISSNWNYLTDMDVLKPGDVLTQFRMGLDVGEGAGEYTAGHEMIVYEKKYVNGQLEAITVIEAGYPYTRFMTMYNEKYYPFTGKFQSFKRLEDYYYVRRLKPQYLNKIDSVYDLSTSYTAGTVMCDRGTNSVYCVNPVDSQDPTQGMELEQPELLLTITDDTATSISIYKDGNIVDTVAIGNTTRNDLRVLDIKSYVTAQGLYTIKTNNSNDVQETFWVQAPVQFVFASTSESEKTIHVPALASLRYIQVRYRKLIGTVDDTPAYARLYRIIVPEEFEEDEATAGQPFDNTWGKTTFPSTLDGGSYVSTLLVYGTDYGTYQVFFYPYPGGSTIPVASSEYSFGA